MLVTVLGSVHTSTYTYTSMENIIAFKVFIIVFDQHYGKVRCGAGEDADNYQIKFVPVLIFCYSYNINSALYFVFAHAIIGLGHFIVS